MANNVIVLDIRRGDEEDLKADVVERVAGRKLLVIDAGSGALRGAILKRCKDGGHLDADNIVMWIMADTDHAWKEFDRALATWEDEGEHFPVLVFNAGKLLFTFDNRSWDSNALKRIPSNPVNHMIAEIATTPVFGTAIIFSRAGDDWKADLHSIEADGTISRASIVDWKGVIDR